MPEKHLQLIGQRLAKHKLFLSCWMPELYRRSMQEIPAERYCISVTALSVNKDVAGSAVKSISRYGMSEGRQVDADLVRPAGFNGDFEQRKFAALVTEFLQHLPVSDGRAAFLPALLTRGHPGASH